MGSHSQSERFIALEMSILICHASPQVRNRDPAIHQPGSEAFVISINGCPLLLESYVVTCLGKSSLVSNQAMRSP